MKIEIKGKTTLTGEISPPASKSMAQRAILTAALIKGTSTIKGATLSDDVMASIDAALSLGAKVFVTPKTQTYMDVTVEGIDPKNPAKDFYYVSARESATTLRLIIPIAVSIFGSGLYDGRDTLVKRPLTPYLDIFDKENIEYSLTKGHLPIEIKGKFTPSDFEIRENISSQFASGMLYPLWLLGEKATLKLPSDIGSKTYLNMTIKILEKFGIYFKEEEGVYRLDRASAHEGELDLETDYSAASVFLVANHFGSSIDFTRPLPQDTIQGDSIIKDILKEKNIQKVMKIDQDTKKIEINLENHPDLAPALSIYGALKEGYTTHLTGLKRLAHKESNRIESIFAMLEEFAIEGSRDKDSLTIIGKKEIDNEAYIDTKDDHRIAMAAGILATYNRQKTTISNPLCVEKSYPDFWEDMKKLGVR